MDDAKIAAEVEELEAEERKLRHEEEVAAEAGRRDLIEADKARLEEIRLRLKQLADLQHQRTALRDAGGDPADAQMRDAKTIEGYWG